MPAIITATGTFSGLDNQNPESQAPGAEVNEVISTHRDTVEQRFQPRALDIVNSFPRDFDGLQEVMQFVGIFAQAYSISSPAAVHRIKNILEAFQQTLELTEQRVYTP
jgi:hypothetical protein